MGDLVPTYDWHRITPDPECNDGVPGSLTRAYYSNSTLGSHTANGLFLTVYDDEPTVFRWHSAAFLLDEDSSLVAALEAWELTERGREQTVDPQSPDLMVSGTFEDDVFHGQYGMSWSSRGDVASGTAMRGTAIPE